MAPIYLKRVMRNPIPPVTRIRPGTVKI